MGIEREREREQMRDCVSFVFARCVCACERLCVCVYDLLAWRLQGSDVSHYSPSACVGSRVGGCGKVGLQVEREAPFLKDILVGRGACPFFKLSFWQLQRILKTC